LQRRPALPDHDDGRGDEHARIRAGDDADDHRESETLSTSPPKKYSAMTDSIVSRP
jgi:hypothetical protein